MSDPIVSDLHVEPIHGEQQFTLSLDPDEDFYTLTFLHLSGQLSVQVHGHPEGYAELTSADLDKLIGQLQHLRDRAAGR